MILFSLLSGLEVVGLLHVRDEIDELINESEPSKTPPATSQPFTQPRGTVSSTTSRSTAHTESSPEQTDASTDGATDSSTETTEGPAAALEELESDPNYASQQPSEPASQAAEEAPDVIAVAVKVIKKRQLGGKRVYLYT